MRSMIGIVRGSLPGILIAWASPNYGVAIAIAGGLIGGLVAWQRIGFVRLLGLTVFAVAGKSIPSLADAVLDATEDRDRTESKDGLTNWLGAGWRSNAGSRQGWLVIVGLLLGAIVGGAASYFELQTAQAKGAGYMLPIVYSRSDFPSQAFYLAFLITTVFGVIASLMASSAFRRPMLMGAGIGGLFGLITGMTSSMPIGQKMAIAFDMALFATFGAIMLALLVDWDWDALSTSETADEDNPERGG